MSNKLKLQIVARCESFRRAGHTFTAQPTIIEAASLTAEQIEALKNEPSLVVVEFDGEAPAKAAQPDPTVAAALEAAQKRATAAEKELAEAKDRLSATEKQLAEAENKLKAATAKK